MEEIWKLIPENKKDVFFQLVKYPVQAATQMNYKLLTAQLARHGKAQWSKSDMAYDSIVALTEIYNNPKWKRIMDFQPRRLPVFDRVEKKEITLNLPSRRQPIYSWNGVDYVKGSSEKMEGLGYEGKAVAVKKGAELTFEFDKWKGDSIEVEIRLLPNHPINGDSLYFAISLDGEDPQIIAYETKGRSEEWKENVLRNQAIRRLFLPVIHKKSHQLTFSALNEGVVLDQIHLYVPQKK